MHRTVLTVTPPSWMQDPPGQTWKWELKEWTVQRHNPPFTFPSGVTWSGSTLQHKEGGGGSEKHALSLLNLQKMSLICKHTHQFMTPARWKVEPNFIYDIMTSPAQVMECCVIFCLVFQQQPPQLQHQLWENMSAEESGTDISKGVEEKFKV